MKHKSNSCLGLDDSEILNGMAVPNACMNYQPHLDLLVSFFISYAETKSFRYLSLYLMCFFKVCMCDETERVADFSFIGLICPKLFLGSYLALCAAIKWAFYDGGECVSVCMSVLLMLVLLLPSCWKKSMALFCLGTSSLAT